MSHLSMIAKLSKQNSLNYPLQETYISHGILGLSGLSRKKNELVDILYIIHRVWLEEKGKSFKKYHAQ